MAEGLPSLRHQVGVTELGRRMSGDEHPERRSAAMIRVSDQDRRPAGGIATVFKTHLPSMVSAYYYSVLRGLLAQHIPEPVLESPSHKQGGIVNA